MTRSGSRRAPLAAVLGSLALTPVLVAGVAGPAHAAPAAPRPATVVGAVLDQHGNRLPGVVVQRRQGGSLVRTRTDARGLYTLRLAAGRVTVSTGALPGGLVPCSGHGSASRSATARAGRTTRVDVTLRLCEARGLTGAGRVTGVLRDQQGEPVPGAGVLLWRGGEEPVGHRTDEHGRFLITRLPAGPYRLTAWGDLFDAASGYRWADGAPHVDTPFTLAPRASRTLDVRTPYTRVLPTPATPPAPADTPPAPAPTAPPVETPQPPAQPPSPDPLPTAQQPTAQPPTATPSSYAAYEAEVLTLTNAARAANGGLPPLALSPCAADYALAWSRHMAATGLFEHGDIGRLFTLCARPPLFLGGLAENIAMGWAPLTAARTVDMWMASPGHRRNILDPAYTHLGVGAARAADGTFYATQDFLTYR